MSAVFLDLLLLVLALWVVLGLRLAIREAAVPVLLLVLAEAERSDCSGLISPGPLSAGLRGNRKSCSVEVGLIEVRGLDVDMAAMSYGRVESALNFASEGDGVVKRGKREDFGQNGGNSWDLYRPSRDQRQERIPGGSTPRSAGRTCTHTHTLSHSLTH